MTATDALDLDNDSPARAAWARRRRELYGFAPIEGMPFYPFHSDSGSTFLGEFRISESGTEVGLTPYYIDDEARPVPLDPTSEQGAEVVDYTRGISQRQDLDVQIDVVDRRVVCRPTAR